MLRRSLIRSFIRSFIFSRLEEQGSQLGEALPPNGKLVTAFGAVKGGLDLVTVQERQCLLHTGERRVLPSATNPKLFQLGIGSVGVVQQRLEAGREIRRGGGTEHAHRAE